ALVREMAVAGARDIDATRLSGRNEPDGDGVRLDRAFIANNVDRAPAVVDKRHPSGVDMRRAIRVVSLVLSHGASCDKDQGMARMGMPAGRATWSPDIADDTAI